MLIRSVIFAVAAAAVASQIPMLLKLDQPTETTEVATPALPASVAPDVSGTAILKADGRGHFTASFRINGKPVEGLVDTGASLVAINESTARRLGFTANSLDFRYAVDTANGKTDAAHVVIDRIEIGAIRVRKVDAFVMRDKALSSTLVGMSFLKKLKSFQVEAGSLRLTQ
jgi:aspartyl protease family protein